MLELILGFLISNAMRGGVEVGTYFDYSDCKRKELQPISSLPASLKTKGAESCDWDETEFCASEYSIGRKCYKRLKEKQ